MRSPAFLNGLQSAFLDMRVPQTPYISGNPTFYFCAPPEIRSPFLWCHNEPPDKDLSTSSGALGRPPRRTHSPLLFSFTPCTWLLRKFIELIGNTLRFKGFFIPKYIRTTIIKKNVIPEKIRFSCKVYNSNLLLLFLYIHRSKNWVNE